MCTRGTAHEVRCAATPRPRARFSSPRRYRSVNFEDPNYNVQLPVFSIHGNHDDPAGDGGLAALDLMSTANLINYFGRCDNFERISLAPVLITKGTTKLALCALARPPRIECVHAGCEESDADARGHTTSRKP